MSRVLFLFMMFSIIGFMWETPYVSIKMKKYVNRGFLHGPYIPIYGCAIVTIVLSMSIFDSVTNETFPIILIEMLFMGLVTAFWEYFTSYVLEKLFHARWWDYSNHKYNINGRISLHVTVFFGLGGFFLYKFVLPLLDKLYFSISNDVLFFILSGFYLFFIIDNILTLIDLIKVRNVIDILNNMKEEFVDSIELKVQETKQGARKLGIDFVNEIININKELNEYYNNFLDKRTPLSIQFKEKLDRFNTRFDKFKHPRRLFNKYPNSQTLKSISFKDFLDKRIKK
ncbi:putative ABC transporter permease [Candidatus Izimaplasma bacterium ZiA1]|uniref:putative ABC transporter permease n=1 Tax=Candidatus Izimoplasma sp. ZiA1 TaxID=2024899 RepID=UPI0014393FC4